MYQTHFEVSHKTGPNLVKADKSTEGPSLPWDCNDNKPTYYNMPYDPNNGTQNEATSMTVKSTNENLQIDYEFTLGQYAGNGIWDTPVEYSEAALYMKYVPRHLDDGLSPSDPSFVFGKPLGALFSMKTFPKVFKTEACWLKIHWTIVFGEGEVDVITDETTGNNFRAIVTPFYCDNLDPNDPNYQHNLIQTSLGDCGT